MVAGRGFIAIACVVFARWNPVGALAAALVLGIADAAQIRLQPLYPDLSYQIFIFLPFVLALAPFAAAARPAHLPAALGTPCRRD
jgi:simple sugar transport system permease protein